MKIHVDAIFLRILLKISKFEVGKKHYILKIQKQKADK